MSGVLNLLSQPKAPSAEQVIITLCDRLDHSPMFEDRKAAVLALRGMAHENRESVASTGLKGLLNALVKDSFDPTSAKVTLETLLILFNPETRRKVRHKRFVSALLRPRMNSPDESATLVTNDISLWLTDQLLHNDDALRCVLDLATTKNDPFTACYALQLVSVMTANRPQETKRILLASNGVTPLVSALGSAQEMIRDEALLLVSALTTEHLEMQKLVAFEGGFDLALNIILESGGAVFGGRFAEDSFNLVANLIEYNTSNQKLFVQSGNLAQWTQILQLIVNSQNDDSTNSLIFQKDQVITNIESALQIGQLLCLPDAEGTKENQDLLKESGAFTLVLQVAFGSLSPPAVRVSALLTASAMIAGNESQQQAFLETDVPYYDLTSPNATPPVVPMAEALLGWCICLNSKHLFELRGAAMVCLRSAMISNTAAKMTFVDEQISQYKTGSATTVNLIAVLAEYNDANRFDPLRVWFAASVMMHLLENTPKVKESLRTVEIGDASLGMDVQPLIQALAGELQGALQQASHSSQDMQDPVIVLGYLQLLTVWLFDDLAAVDDLLLESSTIHSLLVQHQTGNSLVATISVILLGVAYAFCTNQSPLPRIQFHELLMQNLGRDQYKLSIRRFRENFSFINYDESVIFNGANCRGEMPSGSLDASFVDLMQENIKYIGKVMDSDPRVEPSAKISFELVEEIKKSLFDKSEVLNSVETELATTIQQKEKLQHDLQQAQNHITQNSDLVSVQKHQLEQSQTEIKHLQSKLSDLEINLTSVKNQLEKETTSLSQLRSEHSKLSTEASATKQAKEKAEHGINNMTRDLFQLQRERDALDKEVKKIQSELTKLKPKLEASLKSEQTLKTQLKDIRTQCEKEQSAMSILKNTNEKLVEKLKETAAILTEREEEEEELKAQISDLKVKAEANENELRLLKNRESITKKKLEAKEADIQRAQKSLAKSEEEAKAHLAVINEMKQKIADGEDSANNGVNLLQADVDSLKTKLNEATNTIKTLTSEVGDLSAQNKKLTESNTNLRNDVSTATQENKSLTQKLVDLGDDKKGLHQKLDALTSQNDEFSKKNEKLRDNIKKLEEREQGEALDTSLQVDLDKALKSNNQLKEINSKLMKELAVFKKSSHENEEAKNGASLDVEAKFQAEVVDLKAKLREKQNDFDELMLLLEDLSEKKTKYKSRLRTLETSDLSESESETEDEG